MRCRRLAAPEFPTPEGRDSFDYLVQLCEQGLVKRYGKSTPELTERLRDVPGKHEGEPAQRVDIFLDRAPGGGHARAMPSWSDFESAAPEPDCLSWSTNASAPDRPRRPKIWRAIAH